MTAGLELPHLPATTIGDVVDDLGALRGQLPRGDGVRYFNHLYLEVTSEVRRAVIAREAADPAFMEALDVAFANAYLAAVVAAQAGPGAAPPAWRPLFEQRFAKRVAPIQFALAGVNAHLNYDLPIQIVATCRARGIGLDDDSPQHRDFERMADVFQRAEAHAKRWMLTGVLRRLDRVLGHVDDRVAIWSLLRARDAAWTNALTLSHLAGARGPRTGRGLPRRPRPYGGSVRPRPAGAQRAGHPALGRPAASGLRPIADARRRPPRRRRPADSTRRSSC